MSFQMAYHTDAGIKKKTNQDALLLKTAQTRKGRVGLFIVCDGMGGLTQGELASATVIRGMSDWFDTELPKILLSDNNQLETEIIQQLAYRVNALNRRILDYGEAANLKLGTTITALLIVQTNYFLLHIGDSRAYRIHKNLFPLTKDQTLVARELERGNITEEQAKVDPRRNVLLQCVGATPELELAITQGEVKEGDLFMLCTDGFYHEISEEEMFASLKPDSFSNETQMKETVVGLVELVKNRKETDNITVLLTKVTPG
ncbi:serine/threonine-protein phosphatase [Neobacillus sp. MM2021_6]|uniref:PP2C family protein-serine/threonine phosphatase n=1 Tax=Bacillaceae TaxID=186817 RepID=UPI00140DA2EA|nr:MULTISPECIES: PP2C family serine/threonine-protein phosphatase [Bacillaceae]MBO0961672.1 serine/threonine-protein phosphatase [Neobacillus sp. MM2021_6]NHC20562.1 serine/threonine-protein phosphatase [Bacillus sp. MM2020_4]